MRIVDQVMTVKLMAALDEAGIRYAEHRPNTGDGSQILVIENKPAFFDIYPDGDIVLCITENGVDSYFEFEPSAINVAIETLLEP